MNCIQHPLSYSCLTESNLANVFNKYIVALLLKITFDIDLLMKIVLPSDAVICSITTVVNLCR